MAAPLKKTGRHDPRQLLGIVGKSALPTATIVADPDTNAALNIRAKVSTLKSLERMAKAKGTTMKQLLMHALKGAGVDVNIIDLEDRSPSKMRKWK